MKTPRAPQFSQAMLISTLRFYEIHVEIPSLMITILFHKAQIILFVNRSISINMNINGFLTFSLAAIILSKINAIQIYLTKRIHRLVLDYEDYN